MRTFIAIEFEKEWKEKLFAIQGQIRNGCKSGNFTKTDLFHLTLHFLGEVDKEDLELLKQVVFETASQNYVFSMPLETIGFFESGGKNLIWAGLKENKNLTRLVRTLERNLEKQGFPRERKPFKAHITLCRQAVLFQSPEKIKSQTAMTKDEISVTSISLMESIRIGSELSYRPIFKQGLIEGK